MTEPIPTYYTSKPAKAAVSPMPLWITKFAYRILQLSHRPGVYHLMLIVSEDGRKRLEIMTTSKTEELGL